MPLGSNKISVNKNKFNAGSGGLANLPVFNITETLSGASDPSTTIDYQTVTYNITSNRANTVVYYNFDGTAVGTDFSNTSLSGNITTDGDGNATITKTVAVSDLTDDLTFKLQLKKGATGDVLAESGVNRIYAAQYPNITLANSSQISTGNIYLDGTYHQLTSSDTLTVNDVGSLASNAFLTVIGYYDSSSFYHNNAFKVLAVGGGGGSGANTNLKYYGGGGAGGNVVSTSANVENLTNTTYTMTVGTGANCLTVTTTTQGSDIAGANTQVFAGTLFEIVAEGGEGGDVSTDPDGGNVSTFVGGDGARTVAGGVTYSGAGGGASASANGSDGSVRTSSGFGDSGQATGGAGADGVVIAETDRPDYAGTSIGSLTLGGGGGGSAHNDFGNNAETAGQGGAGGGGRGFGGLTTITSGTDGTGGGSGGGGFATGPNTAKGGDGVIYIRYPSGTDFRFISNVNLT